MVSNLVNNHQSPVILKALDSYWYILDQLSNGKKYVAELAVLTKRKPPQISKDLKALRKERLVESLDKDRRKYFDLTIRGRNIFEGVSQAIQTTGDDRVARARVGLDWKAEALIEILSDSALSEDLRMSCSQSLFSLIEKYPAEMLSHDRVRMLVKRIVDSLAGNPSKDRLTDNLRRSVKELVSYAIGSDWESWVLQELYPNLKGLVTRNDAGDTLREWAVSLVGEVARRSPTPATRNEARDELLTTWFHDDVNPEGELGRGLLNEIMSTASRQVFNQIREKAKNTNPRTKARAEILLKEFTNQLNKL